MNKLRWLHISDLHFGQPSPPATWDTVREVMIEMIGQSVTKEGPFDFVIVTGDIAFSGTAAEYLQADSHLADILHVAGTDTLIAVPGNHDLQRPEDKNQSALLVAQVATSNTVARDAAARPDSEVAVYLRERFADYSSWWLKRSDSLNIRRGLFPGEFSLTLSVRGLDVGFVGLNTSAAHVLDASKGGIWLHRAQLQYACGSDPHQTASDWADRHHLTFLLTHHPPSWLSESAEQEYQSEIYTRRRFSAHLFGHTHEAAVAEERRAGGAARVLLQSRSFFGLDSFHSLGGTTTRRSHGFSIATWEPRLDHKALRLQYREAKKANGEWRLFTDAEIGGDIDGVIELSLERGSRALPSAPTEIGPPAPSKDGTPSLLQEKDAEHRAISNLIAHGDTDVLPFPHENILIRRHVAEVLTLVADARQNFAASLEESPPSFIRCLVKVGHLKYRWITQIDPMWNLVFLAEVIAAAPSIEAVRAPPTEARVFSYRFTSEAEGDLFRRDSSWSDFEQQCHRLAEKYEWVVRCDIGNFYGSVSHQRLLETLEQQGIQSTARQRIGGFLKHFADDGHGLPVGGPAARLLSEAILIPIDQALKTEEIEYCRYSDDFALFASTKEEAESAYFRFVNSLRTLQGLVAQDLKTRVLKSKEFLRALESHFAEGDGAVVMKLKLRWDKYADPEKKEYNRLKEAVESIDIFGLITAELAKNRINEAVTRRLISAVRIMEDTKKAPILLLLADNLPLLSPVMTSILQVMDSTLATVEQTDRLTIVSKLVAAASGRGSVLAQDDSVATYFVRLLANHTKADVSSVIDQYFRDHGELVRRECIHAMAETGNIGWLRARLSDFDRLSRWEQRSLLMVSARLASEGARLRQRVVKTVSPFDRLVIDWAEKNAA